ncbi:MAG TPA: M56 family metallopeptidase, partial [Rhodothermales bacterium]|nr:M56 family metallopeptidase [Rhodothermales bacterium]
AAALARLTRRTRPMPSQEVLDKRYADVLWRMLPGRDVRVGIAEHAATPMTAGIFNPTIILPASLLDDDTGLRMALAHEAVHVRRYDTLLHSIEEIVGAAFAVWPFVAAIRCQVAAHREMSCDIEVLGQPSISKKAYAQLIGRFALAPMPGPDLSLGMATSPNELGRRISAMKDDTFRSASRSQIVQAGLAGAAAMLFVILFIVSCTDFVGNGKVAEQQSTSESLKASTPAEQSPDQAVFTVVDQMPEFPGGTDALLKYVQENIEYPKLARKAGIEGKVFVQFVVEKDGSIGKVQVVRGIGSGCDEEAVRVIESMPDWTPGKQGGVPVRVKFSMPFTFKL